jgi:tRNA threonylcarbamoyladenosine biosynthesis protein TsaE
MSEGPTMRNEQEFSLNGPVAPQPAPGGSLPALGRGATLTLSVPVAEQMRELGRRLASVLTAGDLVILSGGLGAGKTTLTQGIGDGLGVRGPITSPTFVIARVHPPLAGSGAGGNGAAGRGPALVHADAYRLGSVLELDDLDLDTDTASSVTVVEWGGGLAEGLSADRLEITITPVPAGPGGASEADRANVTREAASAGGDGDWDGDTDTGADGASLDLPRMVRISAAGERWEGVELPLLDLADRL